MNAMFDDDNEADQPNRLRSLIVRVVGGALFLSLLGGGLFLILHSDADPPRRVNEMKVTMVTPPPPPPPPPPPETKPETRPDEKKFEEQKPIKDEIEEKPETPKEAAIDPGPVLDGPPDLGLNSGPGAGGLVQGHGGGSGGGGSGRFASYASLVQTQIQSALQANEKTRYASLQLIVKLWLDESGRVSRVLLNQSTSDSALDAAIRDQALGQLQLREPPPKDMPMPIVLRINAKNA